MHGWPFIWFGFQVMRSKGCMPPILVHLARGCIAECRTLFPSATFCIGGGAGNLARSRLSGGFFGT
jgi:hypothetical protein